MAARGYTDAAKVAALLGRALSSAEQARAAALIEPAERLIDAYTGIGWLMGAITGELHTAGMFRLRGAPPIASIEQIVASTRYGADGDYTLLTTDWSLDPASGWLTLGGTLGESWGTYDRVAVDYTPSTELPADVGEAATLLVAHLMVPTLDAASIAYSQYAIGQDQRLTFRPKTADLPPEVELLLRHYRADELVIA